MKRRSILALLLATACTQSTAPDAGVDAASPADAAVDSGPVDAGDPLARFRPPSNWLDGGGRVAVVDVWEPNLSALGPCDVTRPGRLFFASESPVMAGFREFVLAGPAGLSWTERQNIGAKATPSDESYSWCASDPPGSPIRCRRQLLDGGVLFAPDAAFDLDSWTASGFISGAIRGPDPRRWRAIWAPDGGYWQVPETSTLMSESGLGTGQLQLPDGGRFAFLWDDGRQIPLGTSIPEYSSWGAAVNSSGLVVGERFAGGNKMAVFWGRETATGRPGELIAVNERGLAVGQERWSPDEWAAIWYRGTTWRLNQLTDAGVGCSYTISSSVNDRDQIAAIRQCSQTFFRRCALIQLRVSD